MGMLDSSTVSSTFANRTVAWVFGILTASVLALQAIAQLELRLHALIWFLLAPFRFLLFPGYVVIVGYVELVVNLIPAIGLIGWLLGLALYLYVVSVLIASIIRKLR